MTDARVILTTVAIHERALNIAQKLVEERLAACVSITTAVESVYAWEGKIEHALEYVLIMKTTSERVEALRERLLQLHAYEVPEFLVLPVESGSEPYLQWLRASTVVK